MFLWLIKQAKKGHPVSGRGEDSPLDVVPACARFPSQKLPLRAGQGIGHFLDGGDPARVSRARGGFRIEECERVAGGRRRGFSANYGP